MREIKLLALSMLILAAATVSARCDTVVSPSLPDIGDKCVSTSIPQGWVVEDLDMNAWHHHTRSGDFSLKRTTREILANFPKVAQIEIGNDDLGISKANGMLQGVPFVTNSGLRGLLSVARYEHNRTVWRLVIPCPASKGVGIIDVEIEPEGTRADNSLARWILKRIKFLPSNTATGFHAAGVKGHSE